MIRAARALLNMSQSQLASELGVTKRTVIRYEDEARLDVRREAVQKKIREVLEKHDIEFLFPVGNTGEGVRFGKRRR